MSNLIDDLHGKHILVAGASSGIGEACAGFLAENGARITLVARRLEKLNEVKDSLQGEEHSVYQYDFSELFGIEELIKQIVNEKGILDGFVFSVGQNSERPLKMIKPEYMMNLMKVNFLSFLELFRIITSKKAYNPSYFSVVAISSISALLGNQAKTAYAATKGALDASIRCLAKEFHGKNIRVNAINPAYVKTHLFEIHNESVAGSSDAQDILNRQYLGLISPEDIAKTVAFLLSKASRFMTGLSVTVDAGRITS
jgi:NAD(P)-dependent dehydrogenase (short-subunit alcohol dehydrogenase family)